MAKGELEVGCCHADLKFHSSSRMKPRWLAFALTLPTDDVLFVQYTVPTIVMSRQCDQHSKVAAAPRYSCNSHFQLGLLYCPSHMQSSPALDLRIPVLDVLGFDRSLHAGNVNLEGAGAVEEAAEGGAAGSPKHAASAPEEHHVSAHRSGGDGGRSPAR